MNKRIVIFILIIFSVKLFSQDTIRLQHFTDEIKLDEFASYFGTNEEFNYPNFPGDVWDNSKKTMSFISFYNYEWFKINIENTCVHPTVKYIYLPYNFIEQIKFYSSINSSAIKYLGDVGAFYPEKKFGFYSISHNFRLELPGESYFTLYVKVHHNSKFVRASSLLIDEDVLHKYLNWENNYLWIWRGFYLFAIFIGLVLFIIFQKRLYLYFIGINIGIGFIKGANLGGYRFLLGSFSSSTVVIVELIGFFILNILTPAYLNLSVPFKKRYIKTWRFMHVLALILLGFLLWDIFGFQTCENFRLYIYFYGLITYVIISSLMMYIIISLMKKGQLKYRLVFFVFASYTLLFLLNKTLPLLGVDIFSVFPNKYLVAASIVSNTGFIAILIRNSYKVHRDRENLIIKEQSFQREMIHSIVNSQELEKNKISKELHDIAGANLSIIKRKFKDNKVIHDKTDKILQRVRNLSHELSQPEFDGGDLVSEIKHLVHLSNNNVVKIKLFVYKFQNELRPEFSIHIFRITQDILAIVNKLDDVSNVYLNFNVEDNVIFISYEDNSKYMIESSHQANELLANIRNRVYLLNGEIENNFSVDKGNYLIIALSIK